MNNQEEAFEKLSRLKVGALFMEMGTGKTKVALDLIYSKAHKVDYILWICPFSIKHEIEEERCKWHEELTIDIVGCESIGRSDRTFLRVLQAVKTHKTFIVVDESLKIKNKDAKRTERILKLGEYAEYKLILNGTPLSKNVLDLWTQMQFLSPKILRMSYNEFKNTYCEYYIRGRLKGLVKKQHNIEHLISLIEPYIFDSELELGKLKHYYDYTYSMDDREEYEELKEMYLQAPNFDFITISQVLQQHYCKSEEKARIIDDLTSEINDRVIVFVKFLNSIPQGAAAITGDMKEKERAAVIKDFRNGKIKVLYITYGCGAFGLNLQFCKNMIFADHTFDYAQRIQAEARIFRMGQESDVNYYNLWCDVGLERLIRGSLDKKTNLLNEVKREINKVSLEKIIKQL
ncbi:MAG: SNF2-related protein [Candidatus Coproplasma sp.]